MAPDGLRQKKRAWLTAKHRWAFDPGLEHFPELAAARGQPAILYIPAKWEGDEDREELCFGWAMAELVEQRGGWTFLVKRLIYTANHVGRIASALAVSGGVCGLVSVVMM